MIKVVGVHPIPLGVFPNLSDESRDTRGLAVTN